MTFPLMAAVQYIAAKVALTTGRGIAGVLRLHYSKWLVYPIVFALVLANTLNAGVDIGAIAAALNLLLPIPVTKMVVPIALMILVLQVWGSYRLIATIVKWLTLTLFAYIGAAVLAHPDATLLLRGKLLPRVAWNREFLSVLVAVLGTTISPYLLF